MKVNYTEPFNFKPIPCITPLDNYWQNGTWKFGSLEITLDTAYQPSFIDIILKGSTALTLVNSKEDSLSYLKLFGGTEFVPETYLDTVTAEGKCIQSNVPEEYTQVNGVTNASSGYIDTGIKANVDDMEFDIVAQYNISSGSSWYVLQSRASSGASIYGISGSQTGNTIVGAFSGTNTTVSITRQLNHIYHINFKCKNGNATLLVEDLTANTSETATGTYTFTAATTNIGLFSNISGGGTLASGNTDVLSAYIKKSGVKVMDYVSCTNSNSVAGYYDWASARFVGATYGSMLARSAITPTPSPTTPVSLICNNGKLDYNMSTQSVVALGTPEVITDSSGNTATCENLLSVGSYKDTQEIFSGVVTRKSKILVLDGTEDWEKKTVGGASRYQITIADARQSAYYNLFVTHGLSSNDTSGNTWGIRNGGLLTFYYDSQLFPTVTDFTNWLTKQYNAGSPVMIIYPLETSTTESVSPQGLSKSPVTATGSVSLAVNTTESSHTAPNPYQPLEINCNNGVVKVSPNRFNKATDDTGHGWYVNSSSQIQDATTNRTIIINCKPNTKYSFWHTEGIGGWRAFDMASDTIAVGDSASWLTGSAPTYKDKNVITTVTTSANAKKLYICAGRSDTTVTRSYEEQLSDFMLVEGEVSTATPYMAYGSTYVDGTTETVQIHGRNLSNGALDNVGYTSTGGTSTSTTFCGNLWKIKCSEGEKYTVSFGNFSDGVSGVFINTWKTDGSWNMRQAMAISGNALTYTIPTGIAVVNFTLYKTGGITIGDNSWLQVEKGDTATTYEPYFSGGTATAEPLCKVSDYQDVQSVIDGVVTRNVGIRVLDGTETYGTASNAPRISGTAVPCLQDTDLICSHYSNVASSVSVANMPNLTCKTNPTNDRTIYFKDSRFTNGDSFKNYVIEQYHAGTPIVLLYVLQTSTTESITPQTLTIQEGTNIVEITQASMDNLELEVSYKAGVEVTVTEVENAQLDNSVEVTVS